MVHWIAPMIFSCLIAIANVSSSDLDNQTQDFQLTDTVCYLHGDD